MTDNSNDPLKPPPEQETPAEEKILQEGPSLPQRGNLWIQVQFNPEAGQLFFSTNVKDGVTWLGMLELARGSFLEKHFSKQRSTLIVPRTKPLIMG